MKPHQRGCANVKGYNFININRQNRRGGGIGIYLRDFLVYKQRDDLNINNDSFESLFLEIENVSDKNVILGVVYRTPDQSIESFFDQLSSGLAIVK